MSDTEMISNDGKTPEEPPTQLDAPALSTVQENSTTPSTTNEDAPTEAEEEPHDVEFYVGNLNPPPWKGTFITAQLKLGLVRLGEKPTNEASTATSSEEEQAEVEPKDEEREILNLKEVERSAKLLVHDVIDNVHPYSNLQLSEEAPERTISQRGHPHFATVGSENPNATPFELAKLTYEHLMNFYPSNQDGTPNHDEVCCKSFSGSSDNDKEHCGCVVNLKTKFDNDLLWISHGNPGDKIAQRIHQARWISFFEALIEKLLPAMQYPFEDESLFSFLYVAFPYFNPAYKNRAPHYVFEDKKTGMTLKTCLYIVPFIIGHHYTWPRAKNFQSYYLSGSLQINVTLGNNYLNRVVQGNGRNSKLLVGMMDLCIDKKKWMDFTPKKSPRDKDDSVPLSFFLEHLERKGVHVGSFSTADHDKYIGPYYGRIRGAVTNLRNAEMLFVAHPSLAKDPSAIAGLNVKANTLLDLRGLCTYQNVDHAASAAMVETQEATLLAAIFEGLVSVAGHSGKKNQDQATPKPWKEPWKTNKDFEEMDVRNARKRFKRATTNSGKKNKSGKSSKKPPHHQSEVALTVEDFRSPEKRKQVTDPDQPPRYFLTTKPSCSSIMQHTGGVSKDNCWEKGLNGLGVTLTEDLQSSCESAHKMCIGVCNAMLPEENRGVEKYEVYSRFSVEMNHRHTNDQWYTIEAPHMDIPPTKVSDLNEKGIFAFIGIVPLQKEGCWTRMHPAWDNKKPKTEEGKLIFSPLGSMVIMPASMVYASGMRTGNGGNPCVKVHYFLKEKKDSESPESADARTNMILNALENVQVCPDGAEEDFPKHPTKKTSAGDHTVHVVAMEKLAELIKKSKDKKATETLMNEGCVKVHPYYCPKPLTALLVLVGL